MTQTTALRWPLILGLGAFALIRPLVRVLESQLGIENQPAVPIAITVVISIVWIAVVGLSATPQPVVTLVLAALVYGLLAIVLSAILSPILDGALAGPLANPIAIVPVLVTNILWGLVAGGLALLLQRARGIQPRRD
ncbi:hypothetical protein [Pseudactinotalea sp.]|uniref:hypothetical protein n=1 Tax=Pseudactinotalea sp. TaxID=1926260 RepID=UPI003B3A9837